MATLGEYYKVDFNKILSAGTTWKIKSNAVFEIIVNVRVHLDFDSNTKFLSFYIPSSPDPISIIKALTTKIDDALKIADSTEINYKLPGEDFFDSNLLQFSGRIFFYVENYIELNEFNLIKNQLITRGLYIHIRDLHFSEERSKIEKPMAFISHDSRDKELIASKIALGLKQRMVPVWYDEYSLKVGDSLRESIEKGLKECRKCILILSPNFLSNNGWTKVEFNSIFTRELLENKKLILPVWYGIKKEALYDYCPFLLDRFALKWENGEDLVINKLNQEIIASE